MRNKGQSPEDTEALKAWVAANKAAESQIFAKMGIGGREESAFTSPRDHQTYVLRHIRFSEPGIMGRTVAFEQTGVNGKRYVVFDTGRAEEIDAEKLQAALEKEPPSKTKGR